MFLGVAYNHPSHPSYYSPTSLFKREGGDYIERGLRRDGDGNDTAIAVHCGLHHALTDGKREDFVVIFRLQDATP